MSEFSKGVLAWMNRHNRKGPFYLLDVEEHETTTHYDFSVEPPRPVIVPANWYIVIWNDGAKTKLGVFSDYMNTRYGVATRTVLNGDTVFDLWNGQNIDDAAFQEMLKVRNHTSELPQFDLTTLKGLRV